MLSLIFYCFVVPERKKRKKAKKKDEENCKPKREKRRCEVKKKLLEKNKILALERKQNKRSRKKWCRTFQVRCLVCGSRGRIVFHLFLCCWFIRRVREERAESEFDSGNNKKTMNNSEDVKTEWCKKSNFYSQMNSRIISTPVKNSLLWEREKKRGREGEREREGEGENILKE